MSGDDTWGFDRLGDRGSSNRRGGRGMGPRGNVHGFGNTRDESDSPPPRRGPPPGRGPSDYESVYSDEPQGRSRDSGPPLRSNFGGTGQTVGEGGQSWNDVFRETSGRMPQRSPSPPAQWGRSRDPSPPPRRQPQFSSSRGGSGGMDPYRVTMILNEVPMTTAMVRQICEWFEEGLSCFEIMTLCARNLHGIREFRPGAFDPEIVVASLAAERVFEVGNDDGRQYDWWASRELERERGIGRGYMKYRVVGRRDGVPVIEMRMVCTREAIGGFFRGIMEEA